MAAIAAPIATPIPLTILPSFSNFPPASSATLALFFISSPKSSASFPASSKPSLASFSALLFSPSSRSILFKSALALLSWICQACVLLSFSPKDSAAFLRAASKVPILFFCAFISLFKTSFLAVKAWTDLSCLSNCEDTSFISDPRTLNV